MITTFASHAILNFILGRTSFIRPANFFLDLSTSPLGANGIGLVRPVDPSYAPVKIPNTKGNFSNALNRVVTITNEFVFNESSVNWLPVVNYALSDESNNIWFYGTLNNSPVNVQINSSAIIDAGVNGFRLDICGGSTSDMSLTTSRANMILDYIFGGISFTPPINYYMGVSLTTISPEGVGITEPVAPGYMRLLLPNNKNTFTFAENQLITLAQQFKFPTALTEWGLFTHFFISDTPTGENVWWCGRLLNDRLVEIGTTLILNPDGFNWVLSDCL